MKEVKTIEKPPSIVFSSHTEDELIRLEKGKFFWKGQEVDDKNKVYERFSEWMDEARQAPNK